MPDNPRRVMVLGATGTIGRATVGALLQAGHEVVCFVRPATKGDTRRGLPEAAELRFGEVSDPVDLAVNGFRGQGFDVLVSCLAARTGAPEEAWAVDHRAHVMALDAARAVGVRHMVLLSAICVQRPKLAFQQAKLAFEAELRKSGITYSIVRPTAYFKSLSGQVARVQAGKPFLIFGDGRLTQCKPISDADLGCYLAGCLTEPDRWNRVLQIGGPGPAITPRQQGEALFAILGQEARFRSVPVALLDAIIALLSVLGTLSPRLRAKADLARIGRYYATESMLVWNEATGGYDADATPEFGADRLFDFYTKLIGGEAKVDLGDHAVF